MKKLLSLLPGLLISLSMQAQTANYNLLIGTYTNAGKSEGIYTYQFNSTNGATELKSVAKAITNPSYLALSPDKKNVYAVSEAGASSAITAFTFDAATGKLEVLNKEASQGEDPCYVTADKHHVIIGNYSGGSLAVYGRKEDGSLSEAKQVIQHTGKSIDPEKRQESAHVHQVIFSPDKKYLISNDLGEDHIYIYNYFPLGKKQVLTIKNVIKVPAGSGPRHLTFSPNGKFAYLAHEFTGKITAFAYTEGKLTRIQEVGTVASDFKGRIDAADIHVSPDGKFLYQSNRGDVNAISVFGIMPTGRLSVASTTSTLGVGPRNFTIDPSGKFLLVANQKSDEVVIFNRNDVTGALTDAGQRIKVGAPVCLVFTKIQ
jgi:6-phosphogluconolactonase